MRKARLRFDTIPVMLIYCFFAVSALVVLALGGSVYKSTVALAAEGFEDQTCLSYIWMKVKTSDLQDKIYLEDFQGITALCVEEEYDGTVYKTLIYSYDGWVRELFFESGLVFSPSDGMKIVAGGSLTLETVRDGVIKAVSGGESVLISIRSNTIERSRRD